MISPQRYAKALFEIAVEKSLIDEWVKQINDISDLLQVYGIKIKSDKVIGDINYSSPVIDKNQNQLNYPFWMKIDKKGIYILEISSYQLQYYQNSHKQKHLLLQYHQYS